MTLLKKWVWLIKRVVEMKKIFKYILGFLLLPMFLIIALFVGLFEVYAMYDEIYEGDNYD